MEVRKRRAKFLTSSAQNEGFLYGNAAPNLFTKDKVRLKPFIENDHFYVLEKRFINGAITEYRHGPFQTSDESSSYAEQRFRWYIDKAIPLYGTNEVADAFVFSYPPP